MHRWTAEMIVVIMSDDVCRREFAAFILDVMNGTIDESVRNRLVPKANGGIRPIAIARWSSRLRERCCSPDTPRRSMRTLVGFSSGACTRRGSNGWSNPPTDLPSTPPAIVSTHCGHLYRLYGTPRGMTTWRHPHQEP